MRPTASRCFLALLGAIAAFAVAGCTVASGSCPECPDAALRDAAVSCTTIGIACSDASASTPGQKCSYADDPTRCLVRSGAHAAACASCDDCAAALAQLRFDACLYDVNECSASPCHNGGVCTDGIGGFTCSCPSGFTGARCDDDVNECAANPCSSVKICVNQYGTFSCICPSGYTGTNCALDIDECAGTNPCFNGGTCNNTLGAFSCTCPAGVSGALCETDVRVCAGTATACADLSTQTCTGGFGCSLGACNGAPFACSHYGSSSCSTVSGCYWNYTYGCSGTPTYGCSGVTSPATCSNRGCTWSSSACGGTPQTCSSLTRWSCSSQPGCSLQAP